jgi:spore germination protein KC
VQKELRTDIYGFGSEFHRRFPRWWREAEERWDDLFPELPVEIKVEVALVSSGLTVIRRLDR